MILNKKEKILMKIIFEFANNKNGQFMIAPIDMLQAIPLKYEFKECDLDKILNDLSIEGYFDLETATKKDDFVYIIKLKELGFSFQRDMQTSKRKLIKSLITTAVIALLSVLIKLILNKIFN